MWRPLRLIVWVGKIVSELIVFHDVPNHVDAEAVDAAIEPEAEHIEHGVLHFGIAPIEIGLLFQKSVVIILARLLVEFPRAAAEVAEPVVGLVAV